MNDVKDTLTPGLKRFFEVAGIRKVGRAKGAHKKAMAKAGIALLGFIVGGSSKESVVPPIATGQLRGSGSVFVENDLVHTSRGQYPAGTPAENYDAGKDKIGIGFNTAYARRLHETKWTPGGKRPSKQAKGNPSITGDVGNKFLEKHLIADMPVLMQTYAEEFRKEAGT